MADENAVPLDRAESYQLDGDAPHCDMVMKGGITSGVVYPRAACWLATRYRLCRVGGSSAGAIAATMVAAAEHGRSSVDGGYVLLNALPDKLGAEMSLLFQPSAATKPAMTLLTTWVDPLLNRRQRISETRHLISKTAPWWGALAAVVSLIPAVAFDIAIQGAPRSRHGLGRLLRALAVQAPVVLGIGLVTALVAYAIAAVRFSQRALAALEANGFGLCDGHHQDATVGHAPLTDWMTDTLDQLAGRACDADAVPLTFGDLWGTDATSAYKAAMPDIAKGEASVLAPGERRRLSAMRDLDVVVMTTDLSHRRPYHFPFDTQVFLWCPSCFADYFPRRVVTQLQTGCVTDPAADPDNGADTVARICPTHGERLWHLPLAPGIPLVVAARLSLSFPGLISAVPFYGVDFATPEGFHALRPVWFSDGGITSNFPMQFFDQPLPSRPTFGINLTPLLPHSDKLVWRASKAPLSGLLPRYQEIGTMFGFLHAIADTMQNWVDNLQISTRGFNDRVAEVRQRPDEGGMNLKMQPEIINGLANRGADAAALFAGFSFTEHCTMRYRIALAATDELLAGMREAYHGPGGYDHLSPDRNISDAMRAQGQELIDLATRWDNAGHPAQLTAPKPQPQLRLVARQ